MMPVQAQQIGATPKTMPQLSNQSSVPRILQLLKVVPDLQRGDACATDVLPERGDVSMSDGISAALARLHRAADA